MSNAKHTDSPKSEAAQGSVVPVYQEYMNPILKALRDLGGSGTIAAIDERVARDMKLSEAVLGMPHDPAVPDGQSEVEYRMAWARSYLKAAGLVMNPSRGQWQLTEEGATAGSVDEYALSAEVAGRSRQSSDPRADAEPELSPKILERLRGRHQALEAKGELLSGERLRQCYDNFRRRFGPDALSSMQGEDLLLRMHARGNKDSLVYWLEFKNDEEFPAQFGSISGGSALKFGIYQSAETRLWMAGSAQQQRPVSIDEAIAQARSQRDELVAGAGVLAEYAANPTSVDYETLERRLLEAAPNLAETAWGHKYFGVLYPELLDDYHALQYQEFHLIKLLRMPRGSRYRNAELFLSIARQLGLPVTILTTVLNRLHGTPYSYWRVGTGEDGNYWPVMQAENVIAVGWPKLPDLRPLLEGPKAQDELRKLIEETYPSTPTSVGRQVSELLRFAQRPEPRDVVLAMLGGRVLGIAEIVGPYTYKAGAPCPHQRPVRWLNLGDWQSPNPEGLRTTFVALRRHPENLVEAERRILEETSERVEVVRVETTGARRAPQPLDGVQAHIQAALERKRQVILYGPPGTGKTYWAMRTARELAARDRFKSTFQELTHDQRQALIESRSVETCCFHPAYGYEDFIEGYRPVVRQDGRIGYDLRRGIFKAMCARAQGEEQRSFFLIVDEINRGDIPRIFGELLVALEKDKRGQPVTLPVSGEQLVVPENLYVIGTMNTADRSIALLDAALRRRFAFIELMPDTSLLKGTTVGGIPLGPWLEELNRRIATHVGRDARHLQVGHSYLLDGGVAVTQLARFAEILRDDIIPLLSEYCYEDFQTLDKLLGSGLVDAKQRRIDQSLFEPARLELLCERLLEGFPEITATVEAAEAEVEVPEQAGTESTDDDEGEETETGG